MWTTFRPGAPLSGLLVFVAVLLLGSLSARAAAPFAESPFGRALQSAARDAVPNDSTKGNRILALEGGYDALLLRIHLIRQARTSIEIQTFIWSNDEVGRLVMYELIAAARRGVKVRIIADQMFSDKSPEVMAFLATASPNLEIKHYRPTFARIRPSLLQTLAASVKSFRDVNQRMHSKVMLVDGSVLITGGRNIENAYFDHSTELNYRDRDVLLIGPEVRPALATFEQFWAYPHSVASRDLVDIAAVIDRGDFRRYEQRSDFDFGGYFEELGREADAAPLIAERFVDRLQRVESAQFVSDEPGKSRGYFGRTARITRELKRVLQEARSSVVLQTPYLVLSRPARDVFRDLSTKHPGLRIQVSTNSFASTDNIIAYSANYRLRNRYVQDLALEVYEFKPQPGSLRQRFPRYEELAAAGRRRAPAGVAAPAPFLCLHAKSFVVDSSVAFVGSFNLDPRSQNLNTEVGLIVRDPEFARQVRAEIEADLRPENSWVIARRELPLGIGTVNGWIGGILSLSPVDLWPIQNTSSFELREGASPVPATHPEFHQRYREAGPFPGTEGRWTTKEILTRIYKAVGAPLTPIL